MNLIIFHAHSAIFFPLLIEKTHTGEMTIWRMSSRSTDTSSPLGNGINRKRGMVLPFTPLAMSFDSVNYYVDMPSVSRFWPNFSELLLSFAFIFDHLG